jgi:hypothetical protein
MLAGLVVAALAGAASVVVALSGGSSGSGRPASDGATGAAGSGAVLADADAVTAFLAGASSDIVAVTTYDYRRLDDALSAGLAVTTGAYRQSFRTALTGSLAASARAQHAVHRFEVLDVGIGALDAGGSEARVLVVGRQLATDRTHPRPQSTLLALAATVRRDGDRYLISDLQQNAGVGTPRGSAELARAVAVGRAKVAGVVAAAVNDAAGTTVHLLVTTRAAACYEVTVTRTSSGWRAGRPRAITAQ